MSSIHLLQYDIPETRIQRARGGYYSRPVMENPSDRLWRAGAVRLTLSCWLIHEGNVPPLLIADFRRFGVKWECVPFDPSASESLARMALNSIRKEIREYLESAKETEKRENERLGTAAGAKAHKRYRTQLAAVALRVRKCLKRVTTAAAKFEITPDMIGVSDAEDALSGIKAGMEARAAAFAEAHKIITGKRGRKDAVAVAIANGDMFGPIAADYLDEMEDGGTEAKNAASQLRTVFGYDF